MGVTNRRGAGRLVRVGTGEAAYRAFVPDPLPPRVDLSPRLVRLLSDADRALGELAGLGRMLPNPHLLIGSFIRREAVLSSRIEGTQTDIAGLYAYEAGQSAILGLRPGSSEPDAREVLNYVRAAEYGLGRLGTLPISLRLIRELHERLMSGVRGERATPGEFRRSQNWIGRPGCTLNDAMFVPPPVPEMLEALDALEKHLHADDVYAPLIRLAFVHYQVEAIHPFLDGNGRIGRLLLSLLMVDWGLLPLPLLYLSAYFERERDAYYLLLLEVSERGAWIDWIGFFLAGVAEQSRDAVSRAQRLLDLQRSWREELTRARASSLLLRLVDTLFDTPILTIPVAQRRLGITYPAARDNVHKLVDRGIVRPVGQETYGRTFVADGVLRIVSETPRGGA